MGLIKEFREFALKGNVADMAVGIIIGGAFGGIVRSLVDDIIMPLVGIAAKADFSNLYIPLSTETQNKIAAVVAEKGTWPSLAEARKIGSVLAYGNFITLFLNFIIIAFAVFLLVKAMNAARKRFDRDQVKGSPEAPPDVKLLTEIRDLLKNR